MSECLLIHNFNSINIKNIQLFILTSCWRPLIRFFFSIFTFSLTYYISLRVCVRMCSFTLIHALKTHQIVVVVDTRFWFCPSKTNLFPAELKQHFFNPFHRAFVCIKFYFIDLNSQSFSISADADQISLSCLFVCSFVHFFVCFGFRCLCKIFFSKNDKIIILIGIRTWSSLVNMCTLKCLWSFAMSIILISVSLFSISKSIVLIYLLFF